jgi:citrate lyase subunit beta / citryl-CoA lyase
VNGNGGLGGAPRSYLYVPGDAVDKLEKIFTRGADAVIVDLEDAVAPSMKERARAVVGAWLSELGDGDRGGTEIWVRVNAGPMGTEDLRAVFGPRLSGVCAPKVSSPVELDDLRSLIAALACDPDRESPGIMALIETARGMVDVGAIAASAGIWRLQLGEHDLAAELGIERGGDDLEFLFFRSQVVLASAAAGIGAPVGPVSSDFAHLDRFTDSTRALKRLGFRSRACIHPAQVAVANEVFTPTVAEMERARSLVSAADRATADGAGTWVGDGGVMMDEALVRAARRLLSEKGEQ